MSDRATVAMMEYQRRVEATREAIEDNPGIELKFLCALLSLKLRVTPQKVEKYVTTLEDAKQIVVDMAHVWTREAFKNYQEAKGRKEALEEQETVAKAKERGSSPLEGYDREDTRTQSINQ